MIVPVVTYGAKVLSMMKKFKKIVSTSHLELTQTKITIALTMKTLRLTAATAVAAVTRMLKASLSMATILSIIIMMTAMMTKKLKKITTRMLSRIALAMTTPRLLAAVVTPSQMLTMLRMTTITCQQTVPMNTSKVQNNNYISFRLTNKIFRMILLWSKSPARRALCCIYPTSFNARRR